MAFEFVRNARERVRNFFKNNVWLPPWLQAGALIGTAIGILSFLFAAEVPDWFGVPPDQLNLVKSILLIGLLVFYFTLVAVLSTLRLETERRLRQVEEGYYYDRQGTLRNGGEPNIAFRVKTFKEILSELTKSDSDEDSTRKKLIATGQVASRDFAKNLGLLYDDTARNRETRSRWKELDFPGKLRGWALYDSETGWGLIRAHWTKSPFKAEVEVTHLDGLFEGVGGKLFGYFLAGYCETVITKIAQEEGLGQARLNGDPIIIDDRVELKYDIKG